MEFQKGDLVEFDDYGIVIFDRIEINGRRIHFFHLKKRRKDWHYFSYFTERAKKVG
jgi:hypothetical protein